MQGVTSHVAKFEWTEFEFKIEVIQARIQSLAFEFLCFGPVTFPLTTHSPSKPEPSHLLSLPSWPSEAQPPDSLVEQSPSTYRRAQPPDGWGTDVQATRCDPNAPQPQTLNCCVHKSLQPPPHSSDPSLRAAKPLLLETLAAAPPLLHGRRW